MGYMYTSIEISLIDSLKTSAFWTTQGQYAHDAHLVKEIEDNRLCEIRVVHHVVNILSDHLARLRIIMRNVITMAPLGDFIFRDNISLVLDARHTKG